MRYASTAAIVALVWLVAAPSGADEPSELSGQIHVASFEASAFAYRETGTLLWLRGPDDVVRLELLRNDPDLAHATVVSSLLNLRGDGWTAILSEHSDSTLNNWGSPWRSPPVGLPAAVRIVTDALLAEPAGAASAHQHWRARPPAEQVRRQSVGSLSPVAGAMRARGDLRNTLAVRGWGHGGRGDILEYKWLAPTAGQDAVLRVRATRRPGQIDLRLRESRQVEFAYPEAFVPLWPLSGMLGETP